MTQAKNTMTKAIKDDIADRFGEKINLDVIHSHNLEAAEEFQKESSPPSRISVKSTSSLSP